MTMSYIWTGMMVLAVVVAFFTGNTQTVSLASLEGAVSAVELCISMTGVLCLWSGMMEIMRQCGLAKRIARGLRPLLHRLYPDADQSTLESISANVSANLLGLGNAATPFGLQAVEGLNKGRESSVASPSMCLFVVCNTASLQLIPSTVASLRAATGSEQPFDILPAVWLSSFVSVVLGISFCKLIERYKNGKAGRIV